MERVFHTWDKWECYPAGFYENNPPAPMSKSDAVRAYEEFLRDIPRFRRALKRVLSEWPTSCEHYLSNENMNRLAWLGQAALCIDTGVPSVFRGGFNRLSAEEQRAANEAALDALNEWLTARGEEPKATVEEAASRTQMDLY